MHLPSVERSTASVGAAPVATGVSRRLVSLDAFRGAVMVLMASSGFGIVQIAKLRPESAIWRFLGEQCEHTGWTGCTVWDLIQPAFMFMVGVAMPWSLSARKARGESVARMFGHACWRALLLILLAVFLSSAWSPSTEWTFNNVLAQIGLGYPFVFLIALASDRARWSAALGILFVYWLLFALHPVGASAPELNGGNTLGPGHHLTGFAAHWEKNANLATTFDRWFLNLFPRSAPYTDSTGGYQTLNFVPSIATMVFGVIAGSLLRTERRATEKLKRLVLAGMAGIALGLALHRTGFCPIVKRLWTPSWVLFSSGAVALCLAVFFALIDWRGWKGWAFPFIVAGLNPITLYCLWQLSGGFIRDSIKTHLGPHVFESFGALYAPMAERISVLAVFWLILLWMYRRKLFLRI